MQVAYDSKMEKVESPRRARRRKNLEILISEFGGAANVSRESGTPKSHFSAMLAAKRGLGDDLTQKLEKLYSKPEGWFDQDHEVQVPTTESEYLNETLRRYGQSTKLPAFSREKEETDVGKQKNRPDELVIPQFDTGGGMGNGKLLLEDQPGVIKSWHVDEEWVRLNVKSHTGVGNLCIVTGFGPSMRPMFNPGDPLLVDRGVKTVETDAVYFFRIGDDGYVKTLQRIPDPMGKGKVIRAKSKNSDFDSFDIMPDNPHFQVLGKVLTVWKSEQF